MTDKQRQQASRVAAIGQRASRPTVRPRLWLLEDSALQAEQTKQALDGYDVVHFSDGAALLEEFARAAPDVLILDWELPGVSGREVLRFVRDAHDEVTLPVLVLTGGEQAMLDAFAAGANDFVTKPCPPVVLRARVGTLLRVHELSSRMREAEQERTDALERVYDAETRMYVALEAADIGTWELDPRTHELQADASAQAIMAIGARVQYERFEQVVHPDDRARLREALTASLDPSLQPKYAVEYRVLIQREEREEREERWNAAWARASFEDDLPVRLVGAVVDVTERKRATEVMERDAAFRERFIAILAHDLRTPLTALRIGSQILARRSLSEAKAKDLGVRIEGTTKRMERMIADLLDFTRRRQGGGMPVVVAEVDFEPLCRSVVQELEDATPSRSIVFAHSGDTRGRWDAGRLQQIVSNLVSNALDYSPEQSPVRVSLRGGTDAVCFEVQNEGPAIPSATLLSLFDPFRRGASASTASRGSRGLGLGLYIVQQIARAHGGDVSARSDPERGTTFTVTLPR